MEYERNMEEIKSGLTGNAKADMAYLMEQMEKYKDHGLLICTPFHRSRNV